MRVSFVHSSPNISLAPAHVSVIVEAISWLPFQPPCASGGFLARRFQVLNVVFPEDKKFQAKQSLKAIYPSIPRQNYPEGIQWRAIENITDRDFTVTEQSAIVVEKIKCKKNTFLQNLCTTEYRHLKIINTEIETEPYLPLSHIFMSLKSYKNLTKGLFVMVHQQYDDALITFFYMADVSQEVAAILPILPLLLEGRLGMKVARYFRSSYSIGTEDYK